jgi:hypothetical protein
METKGYTYGNSGVIIGRKQKRGKTPKKELLLI